MYLASTWRDGSKLTHSHLGVHTCGRLAVFEALGEATMANVTVIREGEAQVLPIDTSQLESLAEGRQ